MTTGSIFWVVVLAASGGILVFVGLLLERFSEKDWNKNVSDFRRCKSRKICGEWFVIAGIVVEIGVGILSAIDAWENEPQNRPIREMTVLVSFRVKGGDFKEIDVKSLTLGRSSWVAFLMLCETNEQPSSLMPGNLIAENFSGGYLGSSPDSDRLYSLRFNLESVGPLLQKRVPVKEINKINRVILTTMFLPKNVEVVGGNATLVVNSEVWKNFTILPSSAPTINGTNVPTDNLLPWSGVLHFPTNK